jgi:diaminopimelate epimerase
MNINFTKYQACGNDFVMIDEDLNPPLNYEEKAALSKILLDRHISIGGDSLLFVKNEGAHVRFQIFENGLEIDMCGNGIRCVALHYKLQESAGPLNVITNDLIIRKIFAEGPLFRVDMGFLQSINRYFRTPLPPSATVIRGDHFLTDHRIKDFFKSSQLAIERTYFLNSGEAHGVIFVDNIDAIDLEKVGGFLNQQSDLFWTSTNLNIAQLLDAETINIRSYERSAFHETLACGTGSVASACAARIEFKLSAPRIKVNSRGGSQYVFFQEERIYLIGPAVKIFDGEIHVLLEPQRGKRGQDPLSDFH